MTNREPLRPVDWGGIGRTRPSVIDTDALIHDVCYVTRHQHPTKLLYASELGVLNLFAGHHVYPELQRHLGEVAVREGLAESAAWQTWHERFRPFVRFVQVPALLQNHPRVQAVARLDVTDVPTAVLALLVCPAIVLSRNQKHLRAVGGGRIMELADAALQLAEFDTGARAASLVANLGYQGVRGTVTVLRKQPLWVTSAVLVLLVLAIVLLIRANNGPREFGRRIAKVSKEVGPPIIEQVGQASRARAAAITVFESRAALLDGPTTLINRIAHLLSVVQEPVSATLVAEGLADYRFRGAPIKTSDVRDVLERYPAFVPVGRRWQLGQHVAA